ncbi:MAG: S-layer homology domain-containing protein, partial [Oscillospiraceae bacterium]|nr:S-layer homology domain-containing protein [Oscillospiraceae bacterium]
SAAVIFANYYDNGGSVTKLSGIFKTPFSDVKKTDENIGSIAVAYAMGFIDKGNGTFGGSKKVTRAEAVQMIYDYILRLSKESN